MRELVLDVTDAPELRRLAEQVATTDTPVVLQRDGQSLARLMPVGQRRVSRRPRTRQPAAGPAAPEYPTIESLRGIAGTLPQPMDWKQVLEIAREDRLTRKLAPRDE